MPEMEPWKIGSQTWPRMTCITDNGIAHAGVADDELRRQCRLSTIGPRTMGDEHPVAKDGAVDNTRHGG